MTENLKPFDRYEAVGLIPSMLQAGLPPEIAIKAAIKTAQLFQDAVEEATPKPDFSGSFVATEKFGEFVPSGFSLYFCTNDGDRFLVAEFGSYRWAVQAAVCWNQYLPHGSKRQTPPATLTDIRAIKNRVKQDDCPQCDDNNSGVSL